MFTTLQMRLLGLGLVILLCLGGFFGTKAAIHKYQQNMRAAEVAVLLVAAQKHLDKSNILAGRIQELVDQVKAKEAALVGLKATLVKVKAKPIPVKPTPLFPTDPCADKVAEVSTVFAEREQAFAEEISSEHNLRIGTEALVEPLKMQNTNLNLQVVEMMNAEADTQKALGTMTVSLHAQEATTMRWKWGCVGVSSAAIIYGLLHR